METRGSWRLLTRKDFETALEDWQPDRLAPPRARDDNVPSFGVNATEEQTRATLRYLRQRVNDKKLEYEHGTDRKTPRGNVLRPYRFTVGPAIAALMVLRASEAFNVCEIDVFLTTELPGLEPGATTRAALLFALADAVRNGGSMALQFTRDCRNGGLPVEVAEQAAWLGVPLQYADRGTIAPDESRELYLRLCGLGDEALERARTLSERGFFSPERLAYLVSAGTWSVAEAEMVLLASQHPQLVFGDAPWAESRVVHAQAQAHGRAAVLAGLVDRALRYRDPAGEGVEELVERGEYEELPVRVMPAHLAYLHGPLPRDQVWPLWSLHPEQGARFERGGRYLVLPRPRAREELRQFLRQDLEAAVEAAGSVEGAQPVLVYPAEARELDEEERREAIVAAARLGVQVLACPESIAALDEQLERRLGAGRRMRR